MRDLWRTDRAIFAVLQKTQQLYLRRAAESIDLVQEKRSAFGFLNQPRLVRRGAGECTTFVPEDFAFHQMFRQRTAVHRHERLMRARTQVVNGAREDFLAGAGFTRDQHRRITLGESRHPLEFIQKRRAIANDLPETNFLLELLDRSLAAPCHARLPRQSRRQFPTPQRRKQKVRRPHFEHCGNIERVRLGRSGHDREMRESLSEQSEKMLPFFAWRRT